MIINKFKEFLVKVIINDPDFRISDRFTSENTNTPHDTDLSSAPSDNDDKSESSGQNQKSTDKTEKTIKRTNAFKRDLGIFCAVLFSLYIINNFLIMKHNEDYAENSVYFSEIDYIKANTIIKVNINTADYDELMSLPGIGSTKANAIIEYRNANNGFKSIEEIMNVSGIGEKTFEEIKENLTIE